jgi:hypothetical protein
MRQVHPCGSLRRCAALLLAACCCLLPLSWTQHLPLRHRLLAETPGGLPEQVHLSPGNTRDQVVVSWAEQRTEASEVTVSYGLAPDALGTTVYASPGAVSTYSSLEFYDVDQLRRPDMDNAVFNISMAQLVVDLTTPEFLGGGQPPKPDSLRPTFGNAANPDNIYSSPFLMSITLHNLQDDTLYFYRVGSSPKVLNFTTAPPPGPEGFPFAVAVFADVGQSIVSHRVISHIAASDARLVLLAGDVTYADGLGARWDAGMRLLEPLASTRLLAACAGNHEVERGEAFLPFIARFPTPYIWSGSPTPLQYAFTSGPVQFIVLNTYAGAAGMLRQAAWLRAVLAGVDRDATPWIVAMCHAPFYSSFSNKLYSKAGQPLRWAVEELLYSGGADILVSGHVHAYERSHPVFNGTLDACGMTQLVVGDAGAYGGPHLGWTDPQPAWSAFRSATFGSGRLEFANATHARWTWSRVACGATTMPKDANAYWTPVWDDAADAGSCRTTGDTSFVGSVHRDEQWIVRDKTCANKLGAKRAA